MDQPAYRAIDLKAIGPGPEQQQEEEVYEVRRKIYPRAVHGWFAGWRVFFVVLTQVIFYGLPWLQWNGRQAVLFDLASRKFYIFGLVFWPQDFIYLTVFLVISALSLFLFTAVAGRLWCGYACPQTVYTEMFQWLTLGSALGRPSGSCSMASLLTPTRAGCASRCASTCALTRASKA